MVLPLLLLVGCTPTIVLSPDEPEPASPQPERAVIEFAIELEEFDDVADGPKRFRSVWHVEAEELAGVGATIDFIRLDISNRDGDQSERSEIGGRELADACGTNVIEASSTWSCDVLLEFNIDDLRGRQRFTFGVHDALGNTFELVVESDD